MQLKRERHFERRFGELLPASLEEYQDTIWDKVIKASLKEESCDLWRRMVRQPLNFEVSTGHRLQYPLW